MADFIIKRYAAISAVLCVLVMTVLDSTVVNVALPVLTEDFKVSASSTVWVVSIYQLVNTMLLLPVSSFGDRYGYRKVFLFGVSLFTAGSLACALSPGLEILIAARALQALGAACIMGVNIALTRLIYPKEILGRGLALNAIVIAVSTAAGPTLAGAILSVSSWHWLFLINIPFGIAAFFIGKRLLPDNPTDGQRRPNHYDWISALENAIVFGLIFISLGNIRAGDSLWNSIPMLAAGLFIGFFYIRRQLGRTSPLLPIDLFRNRVFSLSIMTSTCSFIAQNVVMVSLPFLLFSHLGFSSVSTGLLMTPWPLMTMIVSPIVARWVEHHNPGLCASVGMAVFAIGIGMLMLAGASQSSEAWDIAWRMGLCGLGFGLYQTPNNLVMVSATPVNRTGGASGMQSTARLVGQTLGATGVGIAFSLAGDGVTAINICLSSACLFAAIASVFSLTRIAAAKRG